MMIFDKLMDYRPAILNVFYMYCIVQYRVGCPLFDKQYMYFIYAMVKQQSTAKFPMTA